jgi:predicted dienelactone hydrolase
MIRTVLACLAGCAGCAAAASPVGPAAASQPATKPGGIGAYGQPGAFIVDSVSFDWRDQARDRDVPARVFFPKTGQGPFPVIVFSHGAGSSCEGYGYLGRHWASHGYVSVHITHRGSDADALRAGPDRLEQLRKMVADPQNAINRPKDVSFAIDQLTLLNKSDQRLKGRLDLDRIGVAGHSFGAYTALASAGQVFTGPLGRQVSLGDSRLKAAIAMSTPLAKGDSAALDKTYGPIKIPCLHMTGTQDYSLISMSKPEDRRRPFEHMSAADNYLLVFDGADHMTFAGQVRLLAAEHDREVQRLILVSSTAFWEAYLRDDASARAMLFGKALDNALGIRGTFEKRPAPGSEPATRPTAKPAG